MTDQELIDGMRMFSERCKIISEPTGCLGLAGVKRLVRSGVIKPGQKVGCLITGGNIDMARFTQLLTRDSVPTKISLNIVPRGRSDITNDTSAEFSASSSEGDTKLAEFPEKDEDLSPIVNSPDDKPKRVSKMIQTNHENEPRRSACDKFFSLD